ncbi:TIGR02678 family protein [Kitasatospora sp. NPDC058397]|uniref:TIGR02678 family protein n=1 Tax=unclassified Kitasatospora TaxID=2633591 RepID=UPI00365D81E4
MSDWVGQDGHERREVIRALLRNPTLRRRGRRGRLIDQARVHEEELRTWFDHRLGWTLLVERDRVRLLKVPEDPGRFPDPSIPTARQCTLYCTVLAVLVDCGQQTVITELADRVTALTTASSSIRRFDATATRERRDLVAAIRRLTEDGVLVPTRDAGITADHEQAYVTGGGNALYDIDHRTAAFAIACPVPPSLAEGPDALLHVQGGDLAGHGPTDGELRQAVMRRLVDHPVVYVEDLPVAQRAYLAEHRDELVADLRLSLDTRVEVRADGVAIVDQDFSDLEFPAASAASVAALALADLLAGEANVTTGTSFMVRDDRLLELADLVAAKISRVVAKIEGRPVDAATTLRYALPVLVQFGLVDPHDDGVRVRAAAARYRDPTGRGARVQGEALLLFGPEQAGAGTRPGTPSTVRPSKTEDLYGDGTD